jgi:hypothetical protein
VQGYIVDFLAPAARLVVEVDGAHTGAGAEPTSAATAPSQQRDCASYGCRPHQTPSPQNTNAPQRCRCEASIL